MPFGCLPCCDTSLDCASDLLADTTRSRLHWGSCFLDISDNLNTLAAYLGQVTGHKAALRGCWWHRYFGIGSNVPDTFNILRRQGYRRCFGSWWLLLCLDNRWAGGAVKRHCLGSTLTNDASKRKLLHSLLWHELKVDYWLTWSLILYKVMEQVDMWLHLVKILGSTIDRYLFGTSMVKTDLFKSAHIFYLTVSKCLHILIKVTSAPSSLGRIHWLDTSFLQNLKSTLHPCFLHRLKSRGATHWASLGAIPSILEPGLLSWVMAHGH